MPDVPKPEEALCFFASGVYLFWGLKKLQNCAKIGEGVLRLPKNSTLSPLESFYEVVKGKLLKPVSSLACPRCNRKHLKVSAYRPGNAYKCVHCNGSFVFIVYGDTNEAGVFKAGLTSVQ